MKQDRLDVMIKVLKGELSDDYVTLEEVQEAAILVYEAALEKYLDVLSKTNPLVFYGTDNNTIN